MALLIRLLQEHRRALARVILVVGALAVGRVLWPQIPHETELELELGPEHAKVLELRLSYLLEGEELHGVSFTFERGAPAHVRHRVSLPAGELELQFTVRSRDGSARVLTRRLRTPASGVVRISLSGEA